MMHHLIRTLAFMVIFSSAIAAPYCRRSCGNVTVPYPFGLHGDRERHCYFNESYAVNCSSNGTHEVPYLGDFYNGRYFGETNIQITNISVVDHELRVLTYVSRDCYNASGYRNWLYSLLNVTRFPISSNKNVFTAFGCDTYATLSSEKPTKSTYNYSDFNVYTTGCLTTCPNPESVDDGVCSGIGCCQTHIPKNAYTSRITVTSFYNHSYVIGFNNCSYAFVAATDSFNFSREYLSNFKLEMVPLVLDWSVGNGTCKEETNMTTSMCKENSNCSDADNGTGYRCSCLDGYQGNPYRSGDGGCQDIDECKTSPCEENAECVNKMGSFTCLCRKGYEGGGMKNNATDCRKKSPTTNNIALGVSIGISSLLLLCLGLYCGLRHRKIVMQREKFFQQNGGFMLQKLIAEHKCSRETTIFTDEELKKATNNYHESTLLGQGGHGTVYKGELNNKIVAIKKSKFVDQREVKEFINEVVILTQINHKNVVKLIGCCLEKEVPLLVYEFITHGTLFDHLHKLGHHAHMTWRSRLRIATEIAGALSYLHSDATTQVIHRDIKTANILLDKEFIAKIADFGASRLVPVEQAQDNTLVQGTLGYLDHEYLKVLELTDKSDVYSFGVVLIELLTGMEVLSSTRPEEQKSLPNYFVSKYEEGNLLDIIDRRIYDDIYVKEFIEVAKLSTKCLRMNGNKRPSMKEVSMELEGLIRTKERHSWAENNHGETEHLFTKEITEYGGAATSSSIPYDTIKYQVAFQIESGR